MDEARICPLWSLVILLLLHFFYVLIEEYIVDLPLVVFAIITKFLLFYLNQKELLFFCQSGTECNRFGIIIWRRPTEVKCDALVTSEFWGNNSNSLILIVGQYVIYIVHHSRVFIRVYFWMWVKIRNDSWYRLNHGHSARKKI